MSDISNAEAYRIAARYLSTIGNDDGEDELVSEAKRIEAEDVRYTDLGEALSDLVYSGVGWSEIGRGALNLVNADRKLHKPPSPDELTARDDIE